MKSTVVIGGGPVGGILAAALARAGRTVILVDRNEAIAARAQGPGLEVRGSECMELGDGFTAAVARAFTSVADFAEGQHGDVDLVFACVKATDLAQLCAGLRPRWRPGTPIVSVQNGIDTEDELVSMAGPHHTLRMVVNWAGKAEAPGVYRLHWFQPPNYVGALTRAGARHADTVAGILQEAGLATRPVGDIKRRAFVKTALNASMCPTCTLTGLTMGEAMIRPETRSLVVGILQESVAVGARQGWSFESGVDELTGYLARGGAHRTSMYEDVMAGRRSEIAFMNGKISEHGARLGVPTPYNDVVTRLVRGKEDSVRRASWVTN